MKYRIIVNNRDRLGNEVFEVEAPNLATAILLAGMELARSRNPVLPPEVVKVEIPAGWMEVVLP